MRLCVRGVQLHRALQPLDTVLKLAQLYQCLAGEKEIAGGVRIPLRGFYRQRKSLLELIALQEELGEVGIRPVVLAVRVLHQVERAKKMPEGIGIALQSVVT